MGGGLTDKIQTAAELMFFGGRREWSRKVE